ncbi:MAG: FliH/SctL family protein, partial [Planctomycetota bacterium]
ALDTIPTILDLSLHPLLDHRSFQLEDITQLTDALIAQSEGRLRELQEAAEVVEERMKRQVQDGRDRIERAVEIAQNEIQSLLDECAERTKRVYEERYREGYEFGLREGKAKGQADGYEEGLRRGIEEGTEQGLREGREAGEKAIEEEIGERFRTATEEAIGSTLSLTNGLHGEWTKSLSAARESLLDLSVKIAESIVRDRIETCPETIRDSFERALERIEGESVVVVEIHPDDYATLKKFVDDRFSATFGDTAVELRENEVIERGGLIVRGQFTEVDATIEGQLSTIRDRLSEAGGVA